MMFRLKQFWEVDGKTVNLWDEIVSCRKTIEYRESNKYWWRRLLGAEVDGWWAKNIHSEARRQQRDIFFDAATYEKVPKKAIFTVGFPKNNVPRIETDVSYVVYFHDSEQLGVAFRNVKVITA